ncbi:MAG TPA: hypothetical protein VFG66_08990 [Gemmatimonadales bacterium]|nr:hypothetical protein [Gemmatimonadales bacterium]
MRACKRLLAGVALVALAMPASAAASAGVDPTGARTLNLVHGFWTLMSEVSGHAASDSAAQVAQPEPRAIPPAQSGGPTVSLDDLSQPTAVEAQLRAALRPRGGGLRLTVPHGTARLGDFSIASNESMPGHLLVVQGTADVFGKLLGNLVTVGGDVVLHPGGVVSGDILTLGGEVRDQGGEIGGEVRSFRSTSVLRVPVQTAAAAAPSAIDTVFRRAAGVVGVFLTLSALGFGLVLFGRPNLEVVSDTVSHSFGRAFTTGLLGQILLLPTFGMLVVGLILSVVGIVLLPFVVVVYALLVVVGGLGGYLAVAHAMGETYTRRRLALGAMLSPNSYRYLLVGLGVLAALWMAWAVFGWVPVAGELIRGAAILVTWLLATAGFGAALLSRAGIRENFAGRLIPPEALTDEYLWATPQFGVSAAKRPGSRTPTRGL